VTSTAGNWRVGWGSIRRSTCATSKRDWYPQTPKTTLTAEMLDGARYVALDLYGGEERLAAARTARAAGLQTVVNDVVSPEHPALPLTDIATNSAASIRACFPGADILEPTGRARCVCWIETARSSTCSRPGPSRGIRPARATPFGPG
jgi:hypothetical protein